MKSHSHCFFCIYFLDLFSPDYPCLKQPELAKKLGGTAMEAFKIYKGILIFFVFISRYIQRTECRVLKFEPNTARVFSVMEGSGHNLGLKSSFMSFTSMFPLIIFWVHHISPFVCILFQQVRQNTHIKIESQTCSASCQRWGSSVTFIQSSWCQRIADVRRLSWLVERHVQLWRRGDAIGNIDDDLSEQGTSSQSFLWICEITLDLNYGYYIIDRICFGLSFLFWLGFSATFL